MTQSETPEGYIRASDLIRSRLTPMIIWHTLGPPSLSLTNLPFPKRPSDHLYSIRSVQEVLETRKFHLLRLLNTLRDGAHNRSLDQALQRVLDQANSAPIFTDFPQAALEEVIDIAAQGRALWMATSKHPYNMPNPPPDLPMVWAYTHLKHNCTNYDDLCDSAKGQDFGRYAYPVILERVNLLILDRYPDLPVRGNTRSKTRTCRKCGTQEEGHFNGHYWSKPLHWHSRAKNNKNNTIQEFCTRRCAGAYAQSH